jgi:heptosyltransferase I
VKSPRQTAPADSPHGGQPRIVIVRLSAVGDCVQTMPLACALRDWLPRAYIAWVVEKAAAPLVETVDAVDRVIVVPKKFAWSLAAMQQIRSELAAEQFDLVLDPQGLTKSGLVGWLAGVPRRIGFARPAGREIGPWLQTELVASRQRHMVDRYLELLGPIGATRPRVRFGIQIPEPAQGVVRLLAAQPELHGGYAVLNPGAGWDSKRWPVERYSLVAQHLARRGVRSVVTWGGRRERAWAESIVSQAAGCALLAPPTSLLELCAVLRNARLFVGSDTGPLHIAAALETPCVAMFGSSLASACGPYGSGHIALQAAYDNTRTRKQPGADNWAMRLIAVEQVCQACDEILVRPAVQTAA